MAQKKKLADLSGTVRFNILKVINKVTTLTPWLPTGDPLEHAGT